MDVKSIEGFAGCSNAAFQLIQIVKETTTETERFLAFGGAVPLGLSGGSGVKCDVSLFLWLRRTSTICSPRYQRAATSDSYWSIEKEPRSNERSLMS
jgi:hypothetical protein